MKKITILLALVLLLTGCGKQMETAPKTVTTETIPAVTEQTTTEAETVSAESVPVEDTGFVSFDIYAINDLHGRFADTDAQPGLDELTTYLSQARQGGNTILLATGDMWQGTAESYATNGRIITQWMNRMGFAAMTMGGHEYDWGEDGIRENLELAEFPFLGINVYSRETDSRVDYCESSLVVEFEGVQIGIIGAIGDCYSSISAEHTKDVYFKTGAELTELVKAESEKLRSLGADFIIYTLHDGYDQTYDGVNPISVEELDYYDVTLSQGYVDLVFEADSHFWYVLQDQQGVYHLQAGGNNEGLSYASVMIDKSSGNYYILNAELQAAGKYSYMEDDPLPNQLLEEYAAEIEPVTKVLGRNGQYRNSGKICQLVADLYCTKGVEKWGKEYDIVLGGGYISCRSPWYLPVGDVSYSQIFSLLPFDNQITLCSIQGRDLIEKFLETDNDAYYIKTTAYGDRIRNTIDPDGTYYVVTDNYSAYYAYNNMTVIDVYDPNVFARDLIAEQIAKGSLK